MPRDAKADSRATGEALPRLRIANIIEESRYGGPQRRIALVAERLKKHGIETTVLCARMGAERFRAELSARKVACRVLPLHRITRNPAELIAAVLLFPFETLRLTRILKRERFDLIHCNGSWQWKGVLAGRLSGVPVAWHLNDTHVPRIIHLVFRCLAKLSGCAFIVSGERVRQYYLGHGRLRDRAVFEILPPVDSAAFAGDSSDPDPEISALPGIKVLTIANINPIKGLETLVRVAACFKGGKKEPLSFMVVGQRLHSQKKYYFMLRELRKKLASENLHFMGPKTDIPSCLHASDIGLCCSVAESGPMSAWETAAAGLPLVATDVGDIARLNAQWQFARVVPVGDTQAMVQALRELVKHPEEAQRLGANGARMARNVVDIDICVKHHAAAYRAIVASSGAQAAARGP